VGAIGDECEGWPTLQVSVDGAVVGRTTITDHAAYGAYPVGTAVTRGTHAVTIAFMNDHSTSTCDRNVYLASARMEDDGTPPPVGADVTGVPAGTALTTHQGDLVITTAGTVVDGLDVHGFVYVRAADVTIRRTRIRGTARTMCTGKSLVVATGTAQHGLVVEDSTLAPDVPSSLVNAVMGHDYTFRRVDASGVADTAGINGDNVTIDGSWLHGNVHVAVDACQSGTPTHDDGIQIHGGTNLTVRNSTLEGAYNVGILVAQNAGPTSKVTIENNRLSGGGCMVNLAEKGRGPITGVLIKGNVFGTTRIAKCAVISPVTTVPTLVGNTYTDRTPVTVRKG